MNEEEKGVVVSKSRVWGVGAIINKKMRCIYSKLNSSSFDLFPLFNAL